MPTEAEWEYAARAGTTTRYHWGDGEAGACGYANVNPRNDACRDNFERYAPVGSFQPNRYGLYDMIGNVWEWVEDCFKGNYDGAPSDGSAWTAECGGTARVLRGGSLDDSIIWSAGRNWLAPNYVASDFGFRVARTLPR